MTPCIILDSVALIDPVTMPCRTSTVNSSRDMPLSSVSRTPKSFSNPPVDHDRRLTTGEAAADSPAMGPAIALAMVSGNFIASLFGTSSPTTSER